VNSPTRDIYWKILQHIIVPMNLRINRS